MEFRQLEAYIKAYELKSFSKAADEMFLSQPSISAYIVSLEAQLQVQLLHRTNKEFVPTKAGKVFYEQAKEILALRDKSVKKVKSLSDYTVGSVDILASSVPEQFILPEILSAYHKIFPNVSFNIEQVGSQRVVDGILANKNEIGFVGSKIESNKCVYENFASERLVLIAPNEQRFKNVSQSDIGALLTSEYFIMRESGSGTRQEYEEYLKNIGIKTADLKVSAYFNNIQSIISSVSSGLGLSIVSELAAKQHIASGKVIPLHLDNSPVRHFYIVLKRNCTMSATAESFLKFVREYKKGK